MITLYPDQAAGATAIREAYRQGKKSPLFVAPCAFGKTVLFSFIAMGAIKRGNTVLILAHRTELIDQISETLTAFGIDHGFIAAGRKYAPRPVMVASIQTLAKRMDYYAGAHSMIIIDECHHVTRHNTFGKTLAQFPTSRLLGVTATPCRLSGEGLGDVFDTMIVGPTTQELIDAGRLSPFKLYAPPGVDVSGVKVQAGDYVQKALAKVMDKATITGDAVTHYQRHCPGKPFVAFCVSIEHATHVADQFRQAGIDAVCIHGMMDDAVRKQIVGDFRAGKITGLCSVDLISEGFNVPGIHCGIMLRPTASRSLHIQQIGRCLRTAGGKTHAVILDHAGNCTRHGLPTDSQSWTLEGTVKKKRTNKQEIPIRICPSCFAANPGGTMVCRECGHEWAIEARQVETIDGELVEWVPPPKGPSPARIEEWQARTVEQLTELGRVRGYANPAGWARIRYEARMRKAGA